MGILTYNDKAFLMDGKEYTIVSGAMHYFRIPREYWADRLDKLKQCGFNTVETYTCWNLHEPKEGEFDFTGMLDLAAYVDEAAKYGLNVILRPGPYICSEWDFGGLPAWLLSYENMAIRCYDELFLGKVRRYYKALFEHIGQDRLAAHGGNIIMVQIENEYGSYGDDKDYLNAVVDIYRECNVDCQLFTSDGTRDWMLGGGTLSEYLCVANFGSRPKENFAALKKFRDNQPCMCGEYWCGWFDHWYEEHHVREAEEIAGLFRDMLDAGGSVNFYMFHGGTNFGFMNGANYDGKYQPLITSYDYNALLSETGDLTPAYHAVRAINEEFFGKLPELTCKNSEKKAYGKVVLGEKASLLDVVDKISVPVHAAAPKYMEQIGQGYGFTLYSTIVKGPMTELPLKYDCLHDRAVVYIDGEQKGIIERDARQSEIIMDLRTGEEVKLDILVENMGRINYGPEMVGERKGMTGIRFGQRNHFNWDMYPLEMKELSDVAYEPYDGGADMSCFLRGTLIVEGDPCDTFILLDGFHHGFVMVNGFNLGRYYNDAGPQKTLYCPAPMLKTGENEIVVFETDSCECNVIEFVDVPRLG
ncbi:MAG: beta-galactosidase [Lachnospiraceae bacterium]|nr:beta-galactosidase [Lachnospiraceae bacterium]